MTIKRIRKDKCEHKFIVKGDVGFCCRECVKCGYFEVM